MKEINKITVPVDFLKNADKLVDYAASMAERLSAVIHFVHVVSSTSGDFRLAGAPFAVEYEKKMLADAQARMTTLLEENSERCPGCTGEVSTGDPVDEIVEIARMKDADMIIISTHGARGLEKILLGSVAERVLNRAHCPVLIMNPFKKQ